MTDGGSAVRLDKWMWAARLYKHRAQATRACTAGQVRLNDHPAKAGKRVSVGDRIEALTPGGERIVEIKALSERRGPATEAAELYIDHTPPPPPPTDPWERVLRDRGAGRPTKRDARAIRRLKHE